ncbi:MAG: hypothetical protein A2073_05400 [Deltaproteobacteria bacterium GWC2_42_11]|nr:MAG: hypothetical protein A2073_05400 [Deltaproteobacteria bacterium GWC2_42_11]HBO85293.1 4Fe-4S ferredoxin [Deltaproteobacteria bacterium]
MIRKFLTLRNIRRTYAVFFFTLFLILIGITNFRSLKGYEVSLFLEINPLVALSAFLTSWTIYKGLVLSLLIIIPTFFFGRFFCSWVCPMGILNQVVSTFFNRRRADDEYKINSYRKIFRIKYYILTVLIILSLFGALQTGLLDPVSFITRSFVISAFPAFNYWSGWHYLKQPLFYGGVFISTLFLIVLFANRFLNRFWCRVLCPLGALLGIMSVNPLLRICRNIEKCNNCKKCLKNCHGACEPHSNIRISECLVCMNCIENCPEGALRYGLSDSLTAVHTPVDVSRRRIIEAAVAGIVLFPMMRSVVNSGTLPPHSVIRPPGSISEDDFLHRCIKCSECMKVCPTNVIQPALLEAGFEGLWTPILLNRVGYCEHNCVLCSMVCPTGAIMTLTVEKKTGSPPYKKPVKIGTAFYDYGRCLPWAMNIECIVCEEVCPTSPKAIWFQTADIKLRDSRTKPLKRPYVDPDLCTGCGICENKCPVRDLPAIRVTSIGETRSEKNQMILKGAV